MNKMLETLSEGLPRLGLELPEDVQQTLCAFGEGVVKQNEVMNLTAITDPEHVAKLQLMDSLHPCPFAQNFSAMPAAKTPLRALPTERSFQLGEKKC